MYNLIIIDDEPFAAEEVSSIIDYGKYSFQVLGCFDCAQAALDFIEKNPVHLVISDIKMPDVNGIELLRIINTRFPEIKVILISAYRDFEFARMAISYNAFEYLTKPISYTDFINTLIRLQKELSNVQVFFPDVDVTTEFIEKTLYDYFNNIISKDSFLKQMDINKIGYDILNSQCALAELKINNFEEYLNTTWLHGKDRLFNAIKNIVQNSLFECFAFTLSSTDNSLKIITIKDKSSDFEKIMSDFYSYLKNELDGLFCLDVTIIQTHCSSSVITLKDSLPKSIDYTVNSIIAHLINNEFEEISSIKKYCFSTFSIEELYTLCEQLSREVRQMVKQSNHQYIMDDVAIRTIPKSSILSIYFDQIIESCRMLNNSKPLVKDIILEAIKYINLNYSKEITLSDVSKHVSLNTSYFSNLFKKQTGECFSDFLLRIRMEHAKRFLKNNPDMKIQHIGEKVGYKSMPYFYKIFQAYTGYSPAKYRNILE